ncbi:DgyrCDS13898 [Dimorphilus gyrociliatus]|uniref:PIH1 domain-containing protein 1 n=1 Tax=Dimorphilus gyrociliatus TaxID=2664684 RepID=A0A7I8WCA4_9ANNE|nr:DgyrCDS13898 [Dimorphilus gyrociliatus]
MASRELLEAEESGGFLNKLNFKSDNNESNQPFSKPNYPFVIIVPEAGFCVKMKNEKGDKVFVNICHSSKVPCAQDMTDSELVELLESDDPRGFKIPMSIGEPHAEVDKSGKGCTAYDVVIHPDMITRIQKSQMLMVFFLTVTLEGIEYKYSTTLDKNWVMLKNRKSVGTLQEQHLRTKSRPVEDIGDDAVPGISRMVSEISKDSETPMRESVKKLPEPPYTIVQEPAEGYPNYLIAEIRLPKVKTAATLDLEIGEDRIVLNTRSNVYGLDIFLPYNLIQEDCGAQFDRDTKILSLTMPVQPEVSK